ncbi:MAG: hypothetical protein ACI9N1_002816 [Flavobacteriales bacterium]|jgi:hypothetical protein
MENDLLEEIQHNFKEEDWELVIDQLSSIKLSHVMAGSEFNLRNTRFSILKISEGTLENVIKYTACSKIDFRDVIMWAMQIN